MIPTCGIIFKDFQGQYEKLIEALTRDIDEANREKAKDYLSKIFSKMEEFVLSNHPKKVLNVIIFSPVDNVLECS